jgi:hypothetical protein
MTLTAPAGRPAKLKGWQLRNPELEKKGLVEKGEGLLDVAAEALSAEAASAARLTHRYRNTERAEIIEFLRSRFHGARLVPKSSPGAAKWSRVGERDSTNWLAPHTSQSDTSAQS